VYPGQTVGWIKILLGTEVGLGPGHIVLDGTQLPLTERGTAAPTFAIYGHGDPAPPRKGAQHPPLSAHDYCGQTAGWIRIPLGMEIDLDPGDIVFYAEPAPPRKGAQKTPLSLFTDACRRQTVKSVNLGPCLLWRNGRPSQLLLTICFKWLWLGCRCFNF